MPRLSHEEFYAQTSMQMERLNPARSSLPVALHSAILIHAQSSLQMVWLNFARSSESQFQETIVPRVLRVSHVPSRHLQSAKPNASPCGMQSAKLCEMGLCAPCRGALAVVVRFSCKRSIVAVPLSPRRVWGGLSVSQ